MDSNSDDIRNTGLTRRQLLATLGAGAVSVAAAACTSAPTAAPTTAPAAKPAGTTAPAAPAGGATPAAAAPPASAPAVLKGTTLSFLGGTYFVPAAQELFVNQLKEWGKENGVNVSADFLNWPDLQAKIGAAVQAGAGADLFQFWPGWAFLYADNLVDVTDIVDPIDKARGGYYDWVSRTVKVKGRWLAVPTGMTNGAINYRTSYLKQAGADKFPDTWDELFVVGKKLKAMGKPMGQALGHSLGDPPDFAYPYMWSNGAMEVESDGKTIAFNKPQFVDAMKKFIQAYKDGYDETGLSWDDSANNRAFLSDQISVTYNGSSIYETAKKQNPDIAADMDHADMPKGPAGRFYSMGGHSFGLLKNSKNVSGAKEFLKWWFDPKRFDEWIHAQGVYQLPPTKDWEKDPMWTKDPKQAPFARQSQFGRTMGYAGDPNDKATLSKSKYIVVDTFARAVTDGDAEAAIKWGADQLQQVYGS